MKSVRPGEHKLSIVQGELLGVSAGISRGGFCHSVWFACTNYVQQLLRLTLELMEIRVLWEHARRERFLHNELLSWLSVDGSAAAPGVRYLGQKRVHQIYY
jgi:hypothetical protein